MERLKNWIDEERKKEVAAWQQVNERALRNYHLLLPSSYSDEAGGQASKTG